MDDEYCRYNATPNRIGFSVYSTQQVTMLTCDVTSCDKWWYDQSGGICAGKILISLQTIMECLTEWQANPNSFERWYSFSHDLVA